MAITSRILSLARNVFRRSRVESDLQAEVSSCLQILADQKTNAGVSPEAARLEALKDFGGVDQVKERVREIRMGHLLETVLQDLRYGFRTLLKKPGFTAAALLTLTLGIAANTAIFSVVNSVLLRPLPYPDPDQLVIVGQTVDGGGDRSLSPGDFLDVQSQNHVLSGMAAYRERSFNLIGADRAVKVNAVETTTNLFDLLGTEPKVGRTLRPEDGGRAINRSAVLGYRLWQSRFGGSPEIVGKSIMLEAEPFTVVGVMPRNFEFPASTDLWVSARYSVPEHPLDPSKDPSVRRDAHYFQAIGRLKPGATLRQATADLDTVMKQIVQQHSNSDLTGARSEIQTLHDNQVGDSRSTLLILLGVVTLVFLIACVNVANLTLARGAARAREFAVRASLGASRSRITRQLLTESLLLAVLGGILGIAAALPAFEFVAPLAPSDLGSVGLPTLDGRVLLFTAAASILSALLFGIAPVLQSRKAALTGVLNQGGRTGTARNKYQEALVAAELALAVILLIGAGLLMRSFVRLLQAPLGFDAGNVLTASLSLPKREYPDPKDRELFTTNVLTAVKSVPGVAEVSAINRPPLFPGASTRSIVVQGRIYPPEAGGEAISPDYSVITPQYFAALHIPLISGRTFTEADNSGSPAVLMINAAAAKEFFPNENPLGKRINIRGDDYQEIVGVVGDVRLHSLSQAPRPEVYAPYAQDPWPSMTLLVRTEIDPARLGPNVEEAVRSVNKNEAVANLAPMQLMVEKSIASRRFNLMLVGLFAAVALILAVVGIFGVTSFAVGQRTQEVGVRIALGASRANVLGLILRRSTAIILGGAAAGLAGSLLLTRFIASLLYGVGSTDLLTFVGVSFVMIGAALMASYLPARRATKVDPAIALRYE